MLTLRLLHLLKFLGVFLYAGGLAASLLASVAADRKRAVHAVASPGLVVTWIAGYLLTLTLGVPLTELWILGGFALSLLSHLLLVRGVSRPNSTPLDRLAALAPFLLVLVLMVFKPSWASLK